MIQKIHPHIRYTFWIVLCITLGIFFAMLVTKTAGYEKIPEPIVATTTPAEPVVNVMDTAGNFYFIKDAKQKPNVAAAAYFVGDLETGKMIVAKDAERVFPIASVSKLMTATVAEEHLSTDAPIDISKKALATEGRNGDLVAGQQIKLGNLLYALLLQSSNDAAEAIALTFGRDTFLGEMNAKAKDLGLQNTSFEDPSGLSAHNQSTAAELFSLTKYIKENQNDIFERTKQQSYMAEGHHWFSNNQFLREANYEGGKSGFTSAAEQTVVSTFALPLSETGNRHVGIVLLRTPDRRKDVENILKYLTKNVYYGKESDATLSWVKQKEDTIGDFDQSYVDLAFVGDIMLDRGVRSSVNKNFGGDYSRLFDNLGILKKEDISFANLEGPASDQGKDKHNLYSFRMDPNVIPAIKGAGFDIVSVANNHVGDWGRDAYIDTLARLKENEVLFAGGGLTESDAVLPTIIEKYGMKIGYLAFSDKGPNDMGVTANQAGLLLANNPHFDAIISNASKQVDYLVVSFHFGEEYKTVHNDRQEFLAHKAIDDGAKIVIGAHPHVIEDAEVYKNGYIAYSLGNFIFDQRSAENTMQGELLEIKLHKDGAMETTKNIVKLNSSFQPDTIIKGKPEKVQFETVKKVL